MFKSIFILLLCSLMAVGALRAQYGRVMQGEYFWNADPGEGNGIALVAEDGNFSTVLERVLGNSLALPATVGLHRLGVRVQAADGSWSTPFTTVVEVRQNLIAPVINVSQAEFYWDADPGEGNATPLLAFDGNFNAAFEQVFQNNIALPATVGLHQLGVRVRSNDGNWSSVFLSVIEVRQNLTAPVINVSQAEFYWNADPGEGNATPLLAFDGNFNAAFERVFQNNIALPATVGLHQLGVRVRSNDGNWSSVFLSAIEVRQNLTAPVINVSQAEFYWDSDPGEGNATPLLAFDGNFNAAFERVFQNNIALPATVGLHQLGVRVRSNDGNWSSVFLSAIEVRQDLTARAVRVMQAEFFWDTDPGQGNGTPLLAFDGNLNAAFERLVSGGYAIPALSVGLHRLYTRVRGEDGVWSSLFIYVFDIEASNLPILDTIAGTQRLCATGTITGLNYSVNQSGSYTYTWTLSSGTITAGQNTHAVTVNWASAGTHQIQVIACNAFGCDTSTTQINIAAPAAAPTASASANSFCTGGNTILSSSSAPSGYTYQWYVGGTAISLATNQNYTATTAGNYQVGFIGACASPLSNTLAISVSSPANQPLVIGGGSTCQNSLSLSTSTAPAGYGYQWYVGGNAISGANSQSYTAVADGNYQVNYTGACASALSPIVAVTLNAAGPAAATISSSSAVICNGTNVTLQSTIAPAGYTYQWYRNAVILPTVSSSSYTADLSGFYYVVLIGACPVNASNGVTITTSSSPVAPTVSASATSFCVGGNAILSGNTAPSGYGYQWYLGGNAISGATNQNYTATTAGNYQLGFTGACPSSLSSTLAISTISTPAAATIIGGGSTCQNSMSLSTSTAPAGFGYQWYVAGNAISGANSQSYTAVSSGNYQVNYTGTCPSALSALVAVALNAPAPAAATISSNATALCSGNTATLQASTAPSGYGYQWYLGGNIISGAVNQTYVAAAAGTYTLVFTGGCSVAPSNAIVLNVSIAPAAPTISNNGSSTFCAGSNAILNGNTAPAGYGYQWYLGGNAISGAVNQNYTATTSGNYSLIFTGACPSSNSNTLALTVENPPTSPSIAALGALTFCAGDSALFTALPSTPPANYSYQWYNNGVPIAGAINATFVVRNTGSYTLRLEGNCPSGFSIARTSTVFTPLVPVISYDATLGIIEAISPQNSQINQYNWYFQNAIIPAAIGDFVFADTDGSYFLEIEDLNGCISRSNVIQVGGTIGVTVTGDAQTIYAVYPNPTQGEFMLENKGELQELHIRLTNVLGQVLQDKALSASNIHHLYMDYPAGAYFLQVVDNEGKTTIFTIIKKDF